MLNTKTTLSQSGVLFGTSGARGLVEQFSPDVCAAFTHSFVSVMQQGFTFDTVAIAIDNRPSSYAMAQACAASLKQLGLSTVYFGVLPTPALAFTAMQRKIPSIMVTGSHIPFDRNGLKFYRPDGEISKINEFAIVNNNYLFSSPDSLDRLIVDESAAKEYLQRYLSVFSPSLLKGKRIGVYEHSSAGRDLYTVLLQALGAEVISLDRSDVFVPIDTEAVSEEDCKKALDWVSQYKLDALFSTDGDGDRPLLADETGQWLRGDVLGLLCSQYFNIQALAVPVSCSTAIELSRSFSFVKRTRIGSPYVIEAFGSLLKEFDSVAGFEANGGFLLGSDLNIGNVVLKALPTRDAVLPILAVLALSKETGIAEQVASLPHRYTHSDRIKDFATERSKAILALGSTSALSLLNKLGLNDITVISIDETDGLRISISGDVIVHLRPSGNAPEFRCYVEAGALSEAKNLVDKVLQALTCLS